MIQSVVIEKLVFKNHENHEKFLILYENFIFYGFSWFLNTNFSIPTDWIIVKESNSNIYFTVAALVKKWKMHFFTNQII